MLDTMATWALNTRKGKMPTVAKKPAFTFKPITRILDGKPVCAGVRVVGELLWDEHFTDEKDGRAYALPLPARGENGALAKHLLITEKGRITGATDAYAKQKYINRGEGENAIRLFVKVDGTLGENPWVSGNSGDVRKEYVAVAKQATPHMDYGKSFIDPTIVGPDGKIRNMRIQVKLNQPMTAEEYSTRQQATTERRVGSVIAGSSPEHLNRTLAGLLMKQMKSAGKHRDAVLVALEAAELEAPANFDEVFPPEITTEAVAVAGA